MAHDPTTPYRPLTEEESQRLLDQWTRAFGHVPTLPPDVEEELARAQVPEAEAANEPTDDGDSHEDETTSSNVEGDEEGGVGQ